MRIDLNINPVGASEAGRSTKPGGGEAARTPGGELTPGSVAGPSPQQDSLNQASLNQDSLSPGWLRALTLQVNQLPEIRQDKVAALRYAIDEGNYRVTPEQTAEALIAEVQARSAA